MKSIRISVAIACAAYLWVPIIRAQSPYSIISTPVPEPPAAPAWAMPLQALDEKLPPWIQFNAQYRNRVEESGHIGFKRGSDVYDLSQLRILVAIRPTWWLRLVGETQDAGVFFNNLVPPRPPYQNRWDVRQAFFEIGADKEGWVDVIGGRQMLSFGDERLIGPSDWSNQGRTFDVLRADVHHGSFRSTLLVSSVVLPRDGVIDHHYEGNNLYGVYNVIDHLIPNATVEPYLFWRIAPGRLRLNENQGRGALDEATLGVRVAGKLPRAFSYTVEMALQRGSLGPDSIDAWAGHWNVTKRFRIAGQPSVAIDSNHASGTKDPATRSWGTFDQLYASGHNKLDFADQVGWRNIDQVRPIVTEKAPGGWNLTQTWEWFWRASTKDNFYTASGAVSVASSNPKDGKYIGHEVNLIADHIWRKSIEFGFGYAHLFPGTFLNRTVAHHGYNYPWVYVTFYTTNQEIH